MNGLGRRQRRMIADMATFGGGHWPDHWTLRADDRHVLDSLARKGLVTSSGFRAALTDTGLALSRHLT